MDIDLPEPRHFVPSSSKTAGLQERLHERLEERLGTGCGGPSLELCTASYRLSIDPSREKQKRFMLAARSRVQFALVRQMEDKQRAE